MAPQRVLLRRQIGAWPSVVTGVKRAALEAKATWPVGVSDGHPSGVHSVHDNERAAYTFSGNEQQIVHRFRVGVPASRGVGFKFFKSTVSSCIKIPHMAAVTRITVSRVASGSHCPIGARQIVLLRWGVGTSPSCC